MCIPSVHNNVSQKEGAQYMFDRIKGILLRTNVMFMNAKKKKELLRYVNSAHFFF